MSDHYFIEDENQKENIRTIGYRFRDMDFSFKTDNGLFSKDKVDFASNILLNELPELEGRVLDLGCGYGTIGIVLAKTMPVEVDMVDVNPKAIRFTNINCELNQVNNKVYESDGFAGVDASFDAVILNPPIHAGKSVVYKMYEDCYKHLNIGGRFYIVIQKKHGASTTIEKLEEVFDQCNILYKKKGFFVVESIKGK